MEQEKMDSAVSDIASELGLGEGEPDTEEAEPVEAVAEAEAVAEPAEGEPAAAPEKAADAPPVVRAAPKAWAKEQHQLWARLDKETQDQIEHREKQILEGLGQYSEKAKRADVWENAVKDYMPLIQEQGAQPQEAVRYLFEAHKNLSRGTPEQKAAYLAKVAQSYGIDFAKATAGAAAAADEPASVKELRERTERLERDRAQERDDAQKATAEKIATEVSAFADAKDDKGNLKHPHFEECATHIVALLKAGHTLQQAYDESVYANPVTRAKELARLKTEDEAALRAKAKQEAEKARNASRTNVNSRDTRRTPTAPTAKKWEDTLDATMQEIKARTH